MEKHNQVNKKDNTTFMLLSFFGILFVVDSHIGSNLAPFTNLFPLDSFFMPMFVFISGYFFNQEKIKNTKSYGTYILSRIKKLLIPFLLWTGFYWIVVLILNATGVYHLDVLNRAPIDIINHIFSYGVSFGYNDPSWFALLLFYVIVIYASLRFLLKKIWFEPVALLIFVIIGGLAVYYSQTSFNQGPPRALLLRVAFFIQFFELGICYKKYINKYHTSLFSLFVIVFAVIINWVLISIVGNTLDFPRCAVMDGFHTNIPVLPFITSVTGILFWLSISQLLSSALGRFRVVNFISNNTFFIMTHHLGIKALYYLIFLALKRNGVEAYSSFSEEMYFSDPWYCYSNGVWSNILIFVLTITTITVLCFVFLKSKDCLKGLMSKHLIKSKA